MQRIKHVLTDILAKNCDKTYKTVEKACDRDNFMSSEDAKKFGLIDEVLGK